MNNSSTSRRVGTVAAAAVIGLAGLASLPAVADASPVPAQAQVQPAAQTQQDTLTQATMDWGVKESFRRYIKGPIARGEIAVSGGLTQNADGTYHWSEGTGTWNGTSGEVALPGTVTFTGHKGILETTLSNLRLRIDGTKGTLIADAQARPFIDTTTKGELESYPNLELADVDLSGLSSADGTLSVAGAPTTLTEAGQVAFGGGAFYENGAALDPLSFSAQIEAPVQRETTEQVLSADAENLTVRVSGTGYGSLPQASTGKEAAGVYAAIVDASIPDEQVRQNNIAGVSFVWKGLIRDGAFSTDVTAKTAALRQDADYKVVVWTAHGDPTEQTLLHSAPLTLTEAQRQALFPDPSPTAEPTAEPTEEPTEEPTAEPTEEPTEEPTAEPTEEPTAEPTEEPTATPTAEPTATPTEEPTAAPSATGTPVPSAEPTERPEPLAVVLEWDSVVLTFDGTPG
ncbi:HtaA domain-containing protein [Rothia sp. BD8]|uniref:HtaA domain-containing protein n=1 Tax=Rothia sp. BD8 TaxID=2953894 RepID=UPI00384C7613